MISLGAYASLAKWVGSVVVGACLVGAGWWGGSRSGAEEVAALKLEHQKASTKAAQALTKATAAARQIEHEMGDRFIAVSARHHESLRRVQAENDKLRTDLRAGTERLHHRWACTPSPGVPAPAGARRDADAGARDREESASRAIAAAAECDAQVIGLQSILIAERTP